MVVGITGWNVGGGCRACQQQISMSWPQQMSLSEVTCLVGKAQMPRRYEDVLTVSKLPLDRIRSVVAATLPPFRCRSHMMSLRAICGNICAICSTSARLTPRRFVELAADDPAREGEKKKYRMASADKAAKRMREGMESVCCWSDIGAMKA